MRLLSSFALLSALVLPAAARADTIDYTLTGNGNTITFALAQLPKVAGLGYHDDDFYTISAAIFDGKSVAATIFFCLIPNDQNYGSFEYYDSSFDEIVGGSTQMFAGTVLSPVLGAGSWTFQDGFSKAMYTLTAVDVPSAVSAAPPPGSAPEPSSLILLATGLAGVAGAVHPRVRARRKSQI